MELSDDFAKFFLVLSVLILLSQSFLAFIGGNLAIKDSNGDVRLDRTHSWMNLILTKILTNALDLDTQMKLQLILVVASLEKQIMVVLQDSIMM